MKNVEGPTRTDVSSQAQGRACVGTLPRVSHDSGATTPWNGRLTSMLQLARYFTCEGAILILWLDRGDAPATAELVGVGVVDEDGERIAAQIMLHQRDQLDAN